MTGPRTADEKGCTCFRLRRTARRLTQLYDARLAAAGLTLSQYSLLANLVRRAPPSMHELADVMGMDRTTLTRSLKPLETKGLLRLVSGADRRSKQVELTPAGHAAWEAARGLWRGAQDEVRRRLGQTELASLHRLLDLSFDRLGEDPPLLDETASKVSGAGILPAGGRERV